MIDKIKFIAVIIISVIVVLIAAWLIPPLMRELQGTMQCKYVGDVVVCVAFK